MSFIKVASVVLLSCQIFTANQAVAQGMMQKQKMTLEDRVKMQTSIMQKSLSLTPEQTTKMEAINMKYAKKIEEFRKANNGQPTPEQMAELGNMDKNKNMEMQKVLTEEQYKKQLENEEKRRAQLRERMQRPRPQGAPGTIPPPPPPPPTY